MKRSIVFFWLFIWSACVVLAQSEVFESLTVDSKILGKKVNYSVYLPSDYKTSQRSYPILYLLHGYTGDEIAWIQNGQIKFIADKMIQEGDIAPIIIVMPDGGSTFYINNYNATVRYDDMFFQEFIPQIEKMYRTRGKKKYRAIAGLSMGGFGALHSAMHHPEFFSNCVALSPAVLMDKEVYNRVAENKYGFADLFGKNERDSVPSYYANYNILKLAAILPKEELSSMKYYIDCGDKDYLIEGNCNLHIILKKRGIYHEFRVREGEHNWNYWRSGFVDGLKFINANFNN